MNKKGRDYIRRTGNRPGDLYDSPPCTLWALLEKESFSNCLEPACGNGALLKAAPPGMFTHSFDLLKDGTNFLDYNETWYGDIVTNPPFSLFDEMVTHAKKIATGRVAMIGKTNFFGCVGRSNSGIWDNLEWVYIFNRYIDYQAPYREDGLCYVGNLTTGWFIWNKGYSGNWKGRILDVSKYAVLGQYIIHFKQSYSESICGNNKGIITDNINDFMKKPCKRCLTKLKGRGILNG